ncbi:response regulator [Azospirillum ramasamyi]|uniref:response regulator n=1 Tax=Azospirillum ramasamyi TaxID=682998 RepID=UPI001FEBE2CE|nr:response regulator [Azospirillum ramasamyi]
MKPLVVVVDDDRSIVEGLAILLDGWGYEVVTAVSVAAMEVQLGGLTRTPSLIIADHYLPGGRTGREVVERIRTQTGQHIPSIILTGDSTPERRDEAELMGCQLLLKPVQVGPLREAVEALCRP